MRPPWVITFLALAVPAAAAAEPGAEHAERHHHLSFVMAGTRVLENAHTAMTIGGDYEYRWRGRVGVGAVAEYAAGTVETTTLLGVADIHLWHGLTIQAGPGLERVHHDLHPCARVGVVYELELADFVIAPQIHEDFSAESTIVAGVGLGTMF